MLLAACWIATCVIWFKEPIVDLELSPESNSHLWRHAKDQLIFYVQFYGKSMHCWQKIIMPSFLWNLVAKVIFISIVWDVKLVHLTFSHEISAKSVEIFFLTKMTFYDLLFVCVRMCAFVCVNALDLSPKNIMRVMGGIHLHVRADPPFPHLWNDFTNYGEIWYVVRDPLDRHFKRV